ncbi:BlaI/MecI/CopY family transcriptional regulator [Nonomuraea wenchangensis]|uniref:BlaI/MecI/CopY family transcriptional regulator n=1 Tax=Nonomuraea wenchangensis TaxID=568860 RepID=UPI002481A12A|nr:BlaI/MecI/CopY family transcriptional regulator [Nonomuraea wenchangensis]
MMFMSGSPLGKVPVCDIRHPNASSTLCRATLKDVKGLGELERSIMDILWAEDGALTAREVGRLIADRDLAPTTVMTVLDRLTRKGFLHRTRDGRAWRYQPAESRDAYIAELMLEALGMTGDRSAALTRFAQAVSGPEADILRRALTELEEE